MNPSKTLRFCIMGGGTAGWMAACLLAKRWPQHEVTVIESPEIGIIGVGEGSTPQLRAFFESLGVNEADWMPACNATYKAGISFHGWSNAEGFESYFHPFQTEIDHHTTPHFFFHTRARRTGRDVWAHPDRFFLSSQLARKKLAPIPNENFPFDIGYGYHFDANLVGAFLRKLATSKLNVQHISRTVLEIPVNEAGQVVGLRLDDDIVVTADFFVDCSGFRSTIMQRALGEPFVSFADNLFNDSAVAMPTGNDPNGIACQTRATTLSAGWAWHIPLTNRAGNGYVYSSQFLSDDDAETELRRHLGLLNSDVEARRLKMKVGRVANSWVGNCLAVGLSQGFIEPLEATALHIVQATVEGFADAFERGGFTPEHREEFNQAIGERYDGIRDYIVAHYRLNTRDGDYWRANASHDNLSDSLKSLMTCWFKGEELDREVLRQGISRYYAPLSWHCLFAGYGRFPGQERLYPAESGLPLADLAKIDDFLRRCSLNFPSHTAALDRLRVNVAG